jgi:hypothetical protein
VGFAVNLDQQAALKAGEISDVTAARELATEPIPIWTPAQLLPKDDLRKSERSAELTRAANIRV